MKFVEKMTTTHKRSLEDNSITTTPTKKARPNTQGSRAFQFYEYDSTENNGSKIIKYYKCLECESRINGNKTYSLVSHLKSKHKSIFANKILTNLESYEVQRLKLLQCCVEIVTVNGRPLQYLLDSGFQSIIATQLQSIRNANYTLNLSDDHFADVKNQINHISVKIREKIKAIAKNRLISLMIDAASKNRRSILGISFQYVCNGKTNIFCIGMVELKKKHTAKHLATVVKQTLERYDIRLSQVLTVTTDNASNVLKMSKDLKEELERMREEEKSDIMGKNTAHDNEHTHAAEDEIVNISENETENFTFTDDDALAIVFDEAESYGNMIDDIVTEIQKESNNQSLFAHSIKCAAHTLQLAVKDTLNDIDGEDARVINICKEASKLLRLNSYRNKLEEEQIKITLPKLDVETRWNSTYLMVRNVNYENNEIVIPNILNIEFEIIN